MDADSHEPRVGKTPGSEGQPPVKSMVGHGYYNRHSLPQGVVSRHAFPALREAVTALDFERGRSQFVVADFGAAQGTHSLEPIRAVIEAVKARWQQSPSISVFHTDLPANDFSTLFETVLESPDSYLKKGENVYGFASATSIFSRVFPPNSVSLAYCVHVVHWLSRQPEYLTDHIWYSLARGESHEQWAGQSAADWHTFLHQRATELVPTGRIILIGGAANEEGECGFEPLLDLANQVLMEMVEGKAISAEEYLRMCIPAYARTPREWTGCLSPDSDLVVKDRMKLITSEALTLHDPHFEVFRSDRNARAFAHGVTAFFRAFSEPGLFGHLNEDRTPENRRAIIESCYQRVEDGIALDPEAYECLFRYRFLVLEKKAPGKD